MINRIQKMVLNADFNFIKSVNQASLPDIKVMIRKTLLGEILYVRFHVLLCYSLPDDTTKPQRSC
jgi:hypothetical protein